MTGPHDPLSLRTAAGAARRAKVGRARPMSADDRRLVIVTAAEPLVREHGYAVTTRQLAAAAGVAEGTLFRVFPDKDAIVGAALAQAFSPRKALDELAAIDLRAPLVERVEAVVEVLQARVRGIVELVGALHRGGGRDGRGHGPPGRDDGGEVVAAVAAVLAPDADRLRLPPEEVAVLLRGLVVASAWPGSPRPAPAPSVLVSVLLDGVRTPPPPAAPPVPRRP